MEDFNSFKFINYEKALIDVFNNFTQAGKIHKLVRTKVLDHLKPDISLLDLSNFIEQTINDTLEKEYDGKLPCGVGFPVGLSVNECAAHWTPNPGEKRTLKSDDLIKIDYGVHIDGCIADSAFTFSFDEKFNELIKVSEETTSLAIKLSGVDAVLGEIGRDIQEFIESKEIEINGKSFLLNSFKDLTGHKIMPYMIHAEKCVPNFAIEYPVRMEENEFYAIETFPSTGRGRANEGLECSHYQINTQQVIKEFNEIKEKGKIENPIRLDGREKYLFHRILEDRQTLPFCKKWLKEYKIGKYQIPLNGLVRKNKVKSFPPVNDIKGSYVAQTEHTIFVGENGVKNLTI